MGEANIALNAAIASIGTLLGHLVLTFFFIALSPLLDWFYEEKDCAIGFFIPAMVRFINSMFAILE
jgi:hypothetical protein